MVLNYFGHSCFKVEIARGFSLVIDPFSGIGYEMPKIAADLVICSHLHFDHNYVGGVSFSGLPITKSGVYSYPVNGKTLQIEGVDSFHDDKGGTLRGNNIIFKIIYDGIAVCHMGDIGEKPCSALIEKLSAPDVLLVPVGGTYTVDARGAWEWIDALAPKIIIPMHFKQKGCSIDIQTADRFLQLNTGYEVVTQGGEIDLDRNDFNIKKIIVMEGKENE